MSLFSALGSAANALSTFEQALTVVQNNVNNASTPGYASQTPTLEALPFEFGTGQLGGVTEAGVKSSRDQYAEQNVRESTSQLGFYQQQAESLNALQGRFDISGNTGIPAALNSLFNAFSSWSAAPNDPSSQQNVVQMAQNAATAFQQTAAQVSNTASRTNSDIRGLVNQVNQLAAQLAGYNAQIQAGGQTNAGLDAAVNSALQSLSEIANVTTIRQPDGTVTVLVGGQTALVNGASQDRLSVTIIVPTQPPPANPSGPPTAVVKDASGNDVTGEITGGKLGGALTVRNQIFPAIQGDSNQPGALNQLAQAFAQRVNQLLTSGNVSQGPPPQPGVPLFTYDTTNPANVAASLQVRPGFTSQQLAAIDPGPPVKSNGIALALAGLANSNNPRDNINGQTYAAFFGGIASQVGAQLSSAQNNQSLQQNLVTQAESLRQQISGVDQNQEAAQVLQYQQSYQAAAKMFTVIDSLTQTALSLIALPGTAA